MENTIKDGQKPYLAKVSPQGELYVKTGAKLQRIVDSIDYNRAFTYSSGTKNVLTIVHTGTTEGTLETVTETITYVDPSVNGSNITNIVVS